VRARSASNLMDNRQVRAKGKEAGQIVFRLGRAAVPRRVMSRVQRVAVTRRTAINGGSMEHDVRVQVLVVNAAGPRARLKNRCTRMFVKRTQSRNPGSWRDACFRIAVCDKPLFERVRGGTVSAVYVRCR